MASVDKRLNSYIGEDQTFATQLAEDGLFFKGTVVIFLNTIVSFFLIIINVTRPYL